MSAEEEAKASRLERAKNLFEFLARAQQLKATPARTTSGYSSVLWFADLPTHPAASSAPQDPDSHGDRPLLTVDRVPRHEPPAPDREVAPWVGGRIDEVDEPPTLLDSVPAARAEDLATPTGAGDDEGEVFLEDHPTVLAAAESWLARWRAWADREREDRPVRELYGSLFSTYVTAGAHTEELELVLGVGCLSWEPNDHPSVQRHMLTCPATIKFDDDTGRLTVTREVGLDPITVELDMLDPGLIRNPRHVNDVKAEAHAFEGHPLDREDVGLLARRLVHTLDPEGEYHDEDQASSPAAVAVANYAPALILRKRSQQGLVEIFQTIVAQLSDAEDVPAGILPLIDPDYRPASVPDPTPGAVVTVDDEIFLPLPVNDRQRRILTSVDTRAQTVVQGPPGTGKTHTAAALLSHLLAQGKRVLVAAHTDRALQEVRGKLPEAIKPLSVAVVGSSRSDMADLKVAVERIASTAAEHDPVEADRQINAALAKIDEYRRQRAASYRQLLEAREHEVTSQEHRTYEGTLAAIAQQYQVDADAMRWIAEHVEVPAARPAAADQRGRRRVAPAACWTQHYEPTNPTPAARLIELDTLPPPHEFASLCDAERSAETSATVHAHLDTHEAFDAVRQLPTNYRLQVQHLMRELAEKAQALEERREAWMSEAVFDVRAGRESTWQARAQQVTTLIDQATPAIDLPGTPDPGRDLRRQPGRTARPGAEPAPTPRDRRDHQDAPDGTPKISMFTPKPVKDAALLFQHVRVDGLPPVTERNWPQRWPTSTPNEPSTHSTRPGPRTSRSPRKTPSTSGCSGTSPNWSSCSASWRWAATSPRRSSSSND